MKLVAFYCFAKHSLKGCYRYCLQGHAGFWYKHFNPYVLRQK